MDRRRVEDVTSGSAMLERGARQREQPRRCPRRILDDDALTLVRIDTPVQPEVIATIRTRIKRRQQSKGRVVRPRGGP